MPASVYSELYSSHSRAAQRREKQLGWLSFTRLALFIGIIATGYLYLLHKQVIWLVVALVALAAFLFCLRLYDVIRGKADLEKRLATLNKQELEFLETGRYPGTDGKEHIDPHHPYSYDLDLFGEASLYQYLNRCTTLAGAQALADALLQPKVQMIRERQETVRALAPKVDFRQQVQAAGNQQPVDAADLEKLDKWIAGSPLFHNRAQYYMLLVFPAATLIFICTYIITGADNWLNLFYTSFLVNLFVTFSFARKMMKQMAVSSVITRVLQQFAAQFQLIEKEDIEAGLFRQWQQELRDGTITASQSIQRLASLFRYLDFILNLAVSTLLNGFFLFHVHVLFGLDQWRRKHSGSVKKWLQVLGEIEAIQCFAGFAYNNPSFCYPVPVDSEVLESTGLAHPLIRDQKRVANNVSFAREKFLVLTGSNMSGKSTFLRTVGINLVLAKAGSVVCAGSFTFFPFALHASMRISDSLQDSESFFYAELKRLQGIIAHLQAGEKTFVILDEILRGTNSQDKHDGTVGLIRKLAALNACGIIATHDLAVSRLTEEYPHYVGNYCFESVIINDELLFDYTLKPGVCSRLNASYLMRKMGIIE